MEKANNILLKILGLLLIIAAVMKGWQLLTEPVANKDIWTNRAFLIFTVEFELALGIWLLSGIFRKLSWLSATACFTVFTILTLYKAVNGDDSCGCFGAVKVNPWLTLFAVDLPALIALLIFRPVSLRGAKRQSNLPNFCHFDQNKSFAKNTLSVLKNLFTPLPSIRSFCLAATIGLTIIGVSLPVLALNKPPMETADYMVLEPKTWIGKELPILDYIDIGDQLRKGTWLVLFYHHDCPDCQKVIAELNKTDPGNLPAKVALIEIPPYSDAVKAKYLYGRLPNTKKWFVTTPAMFFLDNDKVVYEFDAEEIKSKILISNSSVRAHERRWCKYEMLISSL